MTKYISTLIFFLIVTSIKAQDAKWKFAPSLGVELGGAIPIPMSEMPDDAAQDHGAERFRWSACQQAPWPSGAYWQPASDVDTGRPAAAD